MENRQNIGLEIIYLGYEDKWYTCHTMRLNTVFVNRKTLGNIGFSSSNQSRANVLCQRCFSVLSQYKHPTNLYVTLLSTRRVRRYLNGQRRIVLCCNAQVNIFVIYHYRHNVFCVKSMWYVCI